MRLRAILVSATLALSIFVLPTAQAAVSDISAAQVALPIINTGEIPAFKRIVALANGSAEIVAALGYRKYLVGRDIASTMPELKSIPIDESAMQVSKGGQSPSQPGEFASLSKATNQGRLLVHARYRIHLSHWWAWIWS